jgi:acyl dehydratase
VSNYFEDLTPGVEIILGTHVFTRDEIVAVASKVDPQPFHLNEEAARQGLFGGLSASGWHTGLIWLRLMVDYREREADFIAARGERPARYGPSPGFENLRWLKPVLVGDTLTYTTRIVDKVDSRSKPAVGLIVWDNRATNQNGEQVFGITSKVFVERRTPFAG